MLHIAVPKNIGRSRRPLHLSPVRRWGNHRGRGSDPGVLRDTLHSRAQLISCSGGNSKRIPDLYTVVMGADQPVDREAAFVALFDAHYGKILAYATRRLAPDAAKDAVADTFVTAWLKLEALDGDPLVWLYGLARGAVANHRRRLARAQRLGERADQLTPRLDERDPADDVAWRDSFTAAFAQLSDDDREVLCLVAWEGLDPVAAAVVLGCSTGAFKVRLHRARRRLRRYLALDTGLTGAMRIADPAKTRRTHPDGSGRRGLTPLVPEEFPCP